MIHGVYSPQSVFIDSCCLVLKAFYQNQGTVHQCLLKGLIQISEHAVKQPYTPDYWGLVPGSWVFQQAIAFCLFCSKDRLWCRFRWVAASFLQAMLSFLTLEWAFLTTCGWFSRLSFGYDWPESHNAWFWQTHWAGCAARTFGWTPRRWWWSTRCGFSFGL